MTGKTISEVLAAVGVIASLVFVGAEVRQNTVAIQGTTRNELAAGAREMLMTIASSPELASVWRRWLAGEDLSADEGMAAFSLVLSYMRNLENVYLQVEAGSVDESALIGYGFAASSGVVYSPLFDSWWARQRDGFHPGFVSEFEARVLHAR